MAEYTVKPHPNTGCHYCGCGETTLIVNSKNETLVVFEKAAMAEEMCRLLNEAFAAGRKSMAKDVAG